MFVGDISLRDTGTDTALTPHSCCTSQLLRSLELFPLHMHISHPAVSSMSWESGHFLALRVAQDESHSTNDT